MDKPSSAQIKNGKHIKTFDDEAGNKLIVVEDAKRITISIKLKSENKRRLIGYITISTRTLHLKRKWDKHRYRAINGYGFNYKIISEGLRFDTISLIDEYCRWKFPKTLIMDNPQFLFFKQQGFELQTFLSFEQLQPYKVVTII